jgi:predicted enzyme involved in methoxymalonyl-ACP biosynthesis
MTKNSKNLFKRQFLKHPNIILCKTSFIECSYQSSNEKDHIKDITKNINIDLYAFMCGYET